ncbi:MAG: L-seryl-tRNA(Sec) selenium transferase [Gammaproteobacteria bacterium]|nr:L-seryl-tRNA(Sec) selenium transferase [Gammaproteobacteria bacterium]
MPASPATDPRARLPSLDRLMEQQQLDVLVDQWGRRTVVGEARDLLTSLRTALDAQSRVPSAPELVAMLKQRLTGRPGRGPRPVWNLTGTVIHTNLGRAPLPASAIAAMAAAAGSSDVEFDLESGGRGERDHHVERLICDLTGAEAATVVNNNAAAVLLVLNTFAEGKEVPVSRGELVEIGGSFRVPDIMRRAGCTLVEVGTTNRTHRADFEQAMTATTGMLFKVHPSNYAITGFQQEVSITAMAEVAHGHGLPLAWDLGSGSLVDLSRFGLPREPLPSDALAAGADLVMFSGDKLLGGPQAGIIVGTGQAIDALRRNPLKRALRVDKITLAALAAVLRLYGDDARLLSELPVLRMITRPARDIRLQAEGLAGPVADLLGEHWEVAVTALASQIGSGALPVANLDSAGLAISARGERGRGKAVEALQHQLRQLPKPVIGRIASDRLLLDLRCLDDAAALLQDLEGLRTP